MTSTSHEDKYAYSRMIISRSLLLKKTNISNKSCRENQNTYIMLRNIFRQ